MKTLDVFKYVKPYIDKYGSTQTKDGILAQAYDDLILDIGKVDFDILEVASDWPDLFIPKIISKLNEKPVVIYCYAPLEICLERNRKREYPVPEPVLYSQAKYNKDSFLQLANDLKVKLLIFDTTGNLLSSYQKFKSAI